MKLNYREKNRIVLEFKRGRSMYENDDVYMLKPGTTEKLVREALRAQQGGNCGPDKTGNLARL